MKLVLLEGPALDDLAQPLDHVHPIHHRADREALDGLSNQLRVRNVTQELLESVIGVRATQLRIEVHDAIWRILRESTKSPQPRVGFFLQALSLADVARYIEANFSERIALKDLALVAELSVFRLVTVFRREMGVSPYRYLNAVRVRKAQQLMRDGVPPAIAAIEVGFFDQSHLCRHFRTICGMTPGQFLANSAPAETLT